MSNVIPIAAARRAKKPRVKRERSKNDFFETPTWVVEAMLPLLPESPVAGLQVLDAGAGTGSISKVLRGAGYKVYGVELDDLLARRARLAGLDVITDDFLAGSWGADIVVMNPPFSRAEAFVRHALACVGPEGYVFALLRLAFVASQKRLAFHAANPSDHHVIVPRPSFTGGGNDSTEYAWMAWGPSFGGRWGQLIGPSKKRVKA